MILLNPSNSNSIFEHLLCFFSLVSQCSAASNELGAFEVLALVGSIHWSAAFRLKRYTSICESTTKQHHSCRKTTINETPYNGSTLSIATEHRS